MASQRPPPAAAAAPAPYRLFVRQPDGPADPGRENTLQALVAVKELQDTARQHNLLLRVDVTRMAAAHLRDRRVQDSLRARGITELPALAHAGGVEFGAREIRRLFEGKIAAALAQRRPAARPARPPAPRDDDPEENLHDFISHNLQPPSDGEESDDDSISKDLTKDKSFLRRAEEDRRRRARIQEKSAKHAAEITDDRGRRPAGGRDRDRDRDRDRGRRGRDSDRIGGGDDDVEDDDAHDQRIDQAFSRRGDDERVRVDAGGDDLDRLIGSISNQKIDVLKPGSGDGEGDDDLMAHYLQNMEVSRL